jgi:hypothetical protein
VNAATLRELSILLKGALWRQEHAARLSLREAWYMAALMRSKQLPSLKTLVGEASPRAQQTPEEVRMNVMAWASAAGLKLHRREGGAATHGR